MKNPSTIIAIIVAIGIGIYIYAAWFHESAVGSSYTNPDYGVSFNYPDSYRLEERDSAGRHTLVLIDEQIHVPPESDGPMAITLDIFHNSARQSVIDWVRGTKESNFNLTPDGRLVSTSVGTKEALRYIWDGLYRGESYALSNRDNILVFSVTFNSPDDRIRSDFLQMLSSVQLY